MFKTCPSCQFKKCWNRAALCEQCGGDFSPPKKAKKAKGIPTAQFINPRLHKKTAKKTRKAKPKMCQCGHSFYAHGCTLEGGGFLHDGKGGPCCSMTLHKHPCECTEYSEAK